jgi:very-short-patch-repair endonuclease
MTDAERVLWRALREANLPHRIRRQHPVGKYIADIAIPSCKLAIELDGGQHADAAADDAQRTEERRERGYRVIRFWNNEVFENMEGVLQAIVAEVERLSPTSP